jgi:hypothetical protein
MRLFRVLPLVVVVGLVASGGGQAASAGKPPTRAVVLKMLTQRYTLFGRGLMPNISKLKVTVTGIRFGTPHIGDSLHDGTPANTRTMVYPVAANATVIACNAYFAYRYSYSGGRFGFFQDEFGRWAFKGLDASSTNEKLASCPL